mmetsp:Transcript_13831/g.19183  ORF Transcript_13831/g.19183 Transcript_13831/m.19183 type:complete len:309 (+) Transcript_13831:2515-3441(+)
MTLKSFHFTGNAQENISKEFQKIKNLFRYSSNYSAIKTFISINARVHKFQKILDLYSLGKPGLVSKIEKIVLSFKKNKSFLYIITKINKNLKRTVLSDVLLKNITTFDHENNKIIINFKNTHSENQNLNYLHFLGITLQKFGNYKSNGTNIYFKKINFSKNSCHSIIIEGDPQEFKLNHLFSSNYFYNLSFDSNHILVITNLLGIEAAREKIFLELNKIFTQKRVKLNSSFISTIADNITLDGKILGISFNQQFIHRNSFLYHSAIEKTIETLIVSSFHGNKSITTGTLESLFDGKRNNTGTGIARII